MIIKKLKTLINGIRQRGFVGFLKYFLFDSDNIYLGYWVHLTGGIVHIEGLTINTNSTLIPISNKSQFIQNRFEKPERDSIKKFLDPTLSVIELGGSLGVVACLTNKMLHNPSAHIVVEAHPEMTKLLKENKRRNNCHFTIIEKAIAYNSKSHTISLYENGFASGIKAPSTASKHIDVPTTHLRAIVESVDFKKFTLICDIEGAEIDLLEHEPEIFQDFVSCLIVELHPTIVGEEKITWFITELCQLGFEQVNQEKNVYVFKNVTR